MHNLAIVGSGPAGYTAGIYASRASLEPILFEGLESGGQLMLTTDVENYPGFDSGVMGPDLMQIFKKQAEKFGTQMKSETIKSIEAIEGGFKLTSSKETYEFKSVIFHQGLQLNGWALKEKKSFKDTVFLLVQHVTGSFLRKRK